MVCSTSPNQRERRSGFGAHAPGPAPCRLPPAGNGTRPRADPRCATVESVLAVVARGFCPDTGPQDVPSHPGPITRPHGPVQTSPWEVR